MAKPYLILFVGIWTLRFITIIIIACQKIHFAGIDFCVFYFDLSQLSCWTSGLTNSVSYHSITKTQWKYKYVSGDTNNKLYTFT